MGKFLIMKIISKIKIHPLFYIVAFITIITGFFKDFSYIMLIILVHEFGHFIVAKKSGIWVQEFAVGMGPKIFSCMKGDTEYSLRALPLGGFLWLLIGGILYTVGGVIYGLKPKKLQLGSFGFHEIFHIFVIAGSVCHYLMILFYFI